MRQWHCFVDNIIYVLLNLSQQAQKQIQGPPSFVYRIIRTFSLGDQFYIFDIDWNREGSRLCFSAVNSEHKGYSRKPVFFMSPSGRCIALEEVVQEVKINHVYGTKKLSRKTTLLYRYHQLNRCLSEDENIFAIRVRHVIKGIFTRC